MILALLVIEAENADEPSGDLWLRAENAIFGDRGGVKATLFRQQIACGAWLDSALSLLPEGLCPSIGQNAHHFYWHGYAHVVKDGEAVVVAEGHSNSDAALAALAMALRARDAS